MKFIAAICMVAFLSCNNDDGTVKVKMPDRAIRDSIKNPAVEQPPAEAIPKDMTIVKDSVITAKDSTDSTRR